MVWTRSRTGMDLVNNVDLVTFLEERGRREVKPSGKKPNSKSVPKEFRRSVINWWSFLETYLERLTKWLNFPNPKEGKQKATGGNFSIHSMDFQKDGNRGTGSIDPNLGAQWVIRKLPQGNEIISKLTSRLRRPKNGCKVESWIKYVWPPIRNRFSAIRMKRSKRKQVSIK